MRWWRKMVVPMRRIWIVVAKGVGIRKTGLVKLRQEVRTCEYQDVHVLWEMLNRNETELVGSKTKNKQFWSISDWARRRTPYLSRSF
ncbi:hypothetical protein RHSIM_Rhsim07G0221300 [Rhododendron simsii]|uniref:Uncharacterized protein n=1 Tax=Rhododendron simsii TaxID=118357 RepID=A0A834GP16_RHOSS|nr:hypothetical protein RHSIM_Rhsim07G0221300 [Rhododendron simsii]